MKDSLDQRLGKLVTQCGQMRAGSFEDTTTEADRKAIRGILLKIGAYVLHLITNGASLSVIQETRARLDGTLEQLKLIPVAQGTRVRGFALGAITICSDMLATHEVLQDASHSILDLLNGSLEGSGANDQDGYTIAELSSQSGLPEPVVTQAIVSLLQQGFVGSVDEEVQGGGGEKAQRYFIDTSGILYLEERESSPQGGDL